MYRSSRSNVPLCVCVYAYRFLNNAIYIKNNYQLPIIYIYIWGTLKETSPLNINFSRTYVFKFSIISLY